MSVVDRAPAAPGAVRPRPLRLAGGAVALLGLVAWTAAVLLTPALLAAGLAADAATTVDYDFAQGTERFFRAEAYDLRLAALVVTGVGLSLVVASLPGPVARAALTGCAVALLVAHLAALVLPAVAAPGLALAVAVASAAVLVRCARAAPAAPLRPPGALPALCAAGLGLGFTIFRIADEGTLEPWVLPEAVALNAAVLTLLVLAAVTAACATGVRWFRSRVLVGAALVIGAAALLFAGPGTEVSIALVDPGLDPDVPSGLAGPLYAVVGATVLGLVFAGGPARPALRVRQGLAALLAGAAALATVPVLLVPGLFASMVTALFHLGDLATVPSLSGVGVVYALLLVGADAVGRPRRPSP